MRVFLVGNFDLLVYPKKERVMYERIMALNVPYNRLASYFNVDKLNGIVALKYEHDGIEAPAKKPKDFVNSIGAVANKKARKQENAQRINSEELQ